MQWAVLNSVNLENEEIYENQCLMEGARGRWAGTR